MERARVLIIDDNDLNLELACVVLERHGFIARGTEGAVDIFQQIAAFRPDLILMDIQLHGSDGLRVARAIKTDRSTRHIPVAAFTAYAMKGDAARMLANGCDAYIAKPIDVATFADQVRAIVLRGAR